MGDNQNSGDGNSGDGNSGDGNSGNWNSGNRNSGDGNSGDGNSGDWNSGNRNSGNGNSGNGNSGNRNSGDGNSGNGNSGAFNSNEPLMRIFNKQSDWTLQMFYGSKVWNILLSFTLIDWINEKDMSEQEKKDNPSYKTTGGYLKVYGYKEAWGKLWDKLSKEDREEFEKLPNFDADIFFEITGIRIGKDDEKKRELLNKADELIAKANELKAEAEKL